MSELAVTVTNIPRIFKVGGVKETTAMNALSAELSQMTGRPICIHTGDSSTSVPQLLVAFEPLLLESVRKTQGKTIFIAGPNAAQLVRGMKNNNKLNSFRIMVSSDPMRGTIGNAITDLEKACEHRDRQNIETALRSFQAYLAHLIKTTLVFVL